MSVRKIINSSLRRLTGYEVRKYQPPKPPKKKAPPKPAPQPPTLHDFTKLSVYLESTPTAFLEALGWQADEVAKVADEFDEVYARLDERYEQTETVFPPRWGVEQGTGLALYGLVRLLRPGNVVETGVADGRSSFMILSALERNGNGMLHSFDVRAEAGNLVRGHEQWNLTISDAKDPRRSFTEAIAKLETIDMFQHDSDHSYANQMFEYESAWPKIPVNGVLASDDADLTKAYLDFATRTGQKPQFLFDRRKILGALRRQEPEAG
ncbi:class I SAM-dependent methyltransferase [Actinoplanes sp. NPDC051346]|uniref:class I SAM-dependent methyltransferase n=1 Tax=Actinoplanes sp. NPDC051346 TaxID=3155048 RepID=UPI00342624CA